MSTLKQYLRDHELSQVDFAREVGISVSYLSEIAAGIKVPSLAVAVKIHRATGGAVSFHSMAKGL